MFIECSNSDGLTGFDYSHDGYWSIGHELQGSKTKVECADTCIHDCFGIHTYDITSTNSLHKTCYHYKDRANLVKPNMIFDSNAKAYVKCSGRNE